MMRANWTTSRTVKNQELNRCHGSKKVLYSTFSELRTISLSQQVDFLGQWNPHSKHPSIVQRQVYSKYWASDSFNVQINFTFVHFGILVRYSIKDAKSNSHFLSKGQTEAVKRNRVISTCRYLLTYSMGRPRLYQTPEQQHVANNAKSHRHYQRYGPPV